MSDSPLRDKPTAKELVPFIVGAKGHMALAAERATRTLGVKVTEYDVIEITTADDSSTEQIAQQFRSSLMMIMFDGIMQLHIAMMASIGEMKPSEVARTYTALVSSFTSLTNPQPRSTLDLLMIATKTAEEMQLDPATVIKDMEQLLGQRR